MSNAEGQCPTCRKLARLIVSGENSCNYCPISVNGGVWECPDDTTDENCINAVLESVKGEK